MYRYYHPEGRGFLIMGGHFLANLLGLVVLGLLIAILIMLIINIRRGQLPFPGRYEGSRQAKVGTVQATKPDPAMEEARMRYARGEISREEFMSITRDLSGGSNTAEMG